MVWNFLRSTRPVLNQPPNVQSPPNTGGTPPASEQINRTSNTAERVNSLFEMSQAISQEVDLEDIAQKAITQLKQGENFEGIEKLIDQLKGFANTPKLNQKDNFINLLRSIANGSGSQDAIDAILKNLAELQNAEQKRPGGIRQNTMNLIQDVQKNLTNLAPHLGAKARFSLGENNLGVYTHFASPTPPSPGSTRSVSYTPRSESFGSVSSDPTKTTWQSPPTTYPPTFEMVTKASTIDKKSFQKLFGVSNDLMGKIHYKSPLHATLSKLSETLCEIYKKDCIVTRQQLLSLSDIATKLAEAIKPKETLEGKILEADVFLGVTREDLTKAIESINDAMKQVPAIR